MISILNFASSVRSSILPTRRVRACLVLRIVIFVIQRGRVLVMLTLAVLVTPDIIRLVVCLASWVVPLVKVFFLLIVLAALLELTTKVRVAIAKVVLWGVRLAQVLRLVRLVLTTMCYLLEVASSTVSFPV